MKKTISISLCLLLGTTLFAATPKSTPALLKKGEEAYKSTCLACHGATGAGDGAVGKMLKPPPRNFSKDKFKQGNKVADIFKTLTKGVPGTAMAAYPHLSEEDRWALAYYVLGLEIKH